jgi:hypothetical protein
VDGKGTDFAGLQRGQTHAIRVELSQGRGKARVYLDDVALGEGHTVRPWGEPGTGSIVVRSIEAVRLRAARVDGSYVAR